MADGTVKIQTEIDQSGFNSGMSNIQKTSRKTFEQMAQESGKSIEEIKQQVKELAESYQREGMNIPNSYKKAYAELGLQAQKATKEVSGEADKIPDAYKEAGEESSSKFKEGLSKLGDIAKTGLIATGAAITAASAGIVAFGKSAVSAGMAFDTSMSQVAATMGTTVDQISNLRDFALEMGSKTAFSATQAADALNYMALAGYTADESMQQLPNVLNLAAAGGIELAYASDMVTDAQSALGLSMEESAELVDKMAMASSKSNTSVAQLGEAILTVGGTAKSLAGGTTELSTALGILADNGIKGAEGGTALRNIILSLAAPTDTAAGAMEELGLSVFDAEGKMRPLNEIFKDLDGTLSTMTEGEQTQVLNTLFNKVDLKSVNALLANTGERFDELSGYIDNATGSAEKMAQTQLDNLSGDITLFQSALEGAQIAVSDKLTPSLRDFVQFGTSGLEKLTTAFQSGGLTGAMDAFGEIITDLISRLADALPQVTEAGTQLLVALLTGIISNIPQIAAAMPEVINAIIISLQTLAPTIASAGGQLLSMLTNGIIENLPTLAQQALTIIQSLGQGIQENLPALMEQGLQILTGLSSSLRESAGLLIDAALSLILSLAQGLVNSLPALIKYVPTIVSNIAGIINDNAPKLVTTALQLIVMLGKGLINAIPTLVQNIPQIIQAIVDVILAFNWLNLGKNVMSFFKNGIANMKTQIINTVTSIKDGIINAIKNLPNTLRNLGSQGIQGLINGIKSLLSSAVSAVQGIGTGIVNTFTNLPSKLLQVGKNIIQGLINGIKNKASEVVQAVTGIGSMIYDKITGFFDIHSPSRLMKWVGQMIGEGLGLGILTKKAYIKNTTDILGDTIKSEITKTQKAIEDMQLEAQKKQAAKELAQYEQSIKDKYTELAKAEKSEREKIQKEILQLQEDWAEKQAQAAADAEEEALNARLDALEQFQSDYEDALKKIEDKQASFAEKLFDYGELFSTVEVNGRDIIKLDDIQEDIDKITEYGERLNAIREQGAGQSLIDEILGMSIDDATAYMEQLLKLKPEQFEKYLALYEEKQRKANEIAKEFYKEDLETLKTEFVDKIPEELSSVRDEVGELGTDSIDAMTQAIIKNGDSVTDALGSVVSNAISKAQLMLNSFVSGLGGVSGFTAQLAENMPSIQSAMAASVQSYTPSSAVQRTINTNTTQTINRNTTQTVRIVPDKQAIYDIVVEENNRRGSSFVLGKGLT